MGMNANTFQRAVEYLAVSIYEDHKTTRSPDWKTTWPSVRKVFRDRAEHIMIGIANIVEEGTANVNKESSSPQEANGVESGSPARPCGELQRAVDRD